MRIEQGKQNRKQGEQGQRGTKQAQGSQPQALAVELYRRMCLVRAFDRKVKSMSLQGRAGIYPILCGQEAAQVGAGFALAEEDWLAPTFRDSGVILQRNIDPSDLLLYWMGLETGHPLHERTLPITAPVATQLSQATGLGWAEQLGRSGHRVLALFGDGATSKGDFHEALNLAAVMKLPIVFYCQNNQWALSTPLHHQTSLTDLSHRARAYGMRAVQIDGNCVETAYHTVRSALDSVMDGAGPMFIEARTYRLEGHSTTDNPSTYRDKEEAAQWKKRDPLTLQRQQLEAAGLWDQAMQDHLDEELREQLNQAVQRAEALKEEARLEAPSELFEHVYETPSSQLRRQAQEATWLAGLCDTPAPQTKPLPFLQPETRQPESRANGSAHHSPEHSTHTPSEQISEQPMYASLSRAQSSVTTTEIVRREFAHLEQKDGPSSTMNMVQALQRAMYEALADDPRVLVFGEDVGRLGGVFRVTQGLQRRFGEQRVVDMPLSEAAIAGAALGLAMAGYRPIFEIQFGGFLFSAAEQLFLHAPRIRARNRGELTAPVICRAPYGGGVGAPESHSESPEMYFVHTPGWKVVVPSSPRMARALLLASLQDPDPVLFLEPMRLYRQQTEAVPEAPEQFPLGRARRIRHGDDLTLISYGAMLQPTLQAAEALQQSKGIQAEVIDLVTLSPLDMGPIETTLARTGHGLIIHEGPRTGGLGGEIMAHLYEVLSGEVRLGRVTGWDIPYPYPAHEHKYLPNVQRIAHAALQLFKSSQKQHKQQRKEQHGSRTRFA